MILAIEVAYDQGQKAQDTARLLEILNRAPTTLQHIN